MQHDEQDAPMSDGELGAKLAAHLDHDFNREYGAQRRRAMHSTDPSAPAKATTTNNLVRGFEQTEKLVSRVMHLAQELLGPRVVPTSQEGAKDRPVGVLNTIDEAVNVMVARIGEAHEALNAIERRLL